MVSDPISPNGKSVKLWGWGAALGMYLLVFWDWIPMVAVQQFYCVKESGFWIYKTLDQWKTENPGVAETLVANDRVVSGPNYDVLNQRFDRIIRETRYFPLNYMMRVEWQLVDSKTDEVLTRYVNFSASHERQQAGWSGWKFWLSNPSCIGGDINKSHFYQFFSAAKHIGDGVKK